MENKAKSFKVMTIVGTRPEIIKLSRVLAALETYTNHVLVYTGQNYDYELSEIFFKDLGLRSPNYFLDSAGSNAAETIGLTIIKIDKLLAQEQPDAVLIYGDTNSCLAAIAVKRKKIPLFHMEAGNRCFDQRVPEEINRKIIDHISDINLTISEHARRYLLAEGLRPETIFKVGSSLPEIFKFYMPKIEGCNILATLNVLPQDYILVSLHREENVDCPVRLANLMASLHQVVNTYHKDIFISTHPRTQLRLQETSEVNQWMTMHPRIHFLKPFGFLAYMKLQMAAFCVLSDSGTITEDANLLAFPAVMLREAHERPEGMDVGTLIMSGLNTERIIEAIAVVTAMRTRNEKFAIASDYTAEHVANSVVKIILSYTDYINRTVWYKPLMPENAYALND